MNCCSGSRDGIVLAATRFVLAALLAVCPNANAAEPLTISAVRYWSLADLTRIAVVTNGPFTYKTDRLTNPQRIFFDLHDARPDFVKKGQHIIAVNDTRVRQIRVAETQPSVTRIVVDLEDGDFEVITSQSSKPDQILLEVRAKHPTVSSTPLLSTTGVKQIEPIAAPSVAAKAFVPQKLPKPVRYDRPIPEAPFVASRPPSRVSPWWTQVKIPVAELPSGLKVRPQSPSEDALSRATSKFADAPLANPATRNSNGERSLTRALGLKMRRVVIDPGHGGHDQGSAGVTGLLEKELVLDVSKRLGQLVQEQLGSEVVYTRSTDVFIPLEERPKIANHRKSDIFISIHANSSPVRNVTGVETYILSFTTSRAALDTAARENASSERSISELREILQKIALKDKVDESREFAGKVQGALTTFNPGSSVKRDRGVKRAPFVVLIGATMPAILAEIGFLSNPKEEANLRKPEYRQKLAEALFKGVAQYAESLSHFQVAQRKTPSSE